MKELEYNQPLPKVLMVDYLELPYVLPGFKVKCFRDTVADIEIIQIKGVYKKRLIGFNMAYSWMEKELHVFEEDIFRLRWAEAIGYIKATIEDYDKRCIKHATTN